LLDVISLSKKSDNFNFKYIISKLDNLITGQLLDINNTTNDTTILDICDTSQSLYKELEELNEVPFLDTKNKYYLKILN